MAAPVVVRGMRAADLPFAAALTLGEGWHSDTLEEFEGFFARDPDGGLLAELDGEPARIGVATTYGEIGFLGQIVNPPWRMAYGPDQGLARDQALLANGTSAKG